MRQSLWLKFSLNISSYRKTAATIFAYTISGTRYNKIISNSVQMKFFKSNLKKLFQRVADIVYNRAAAKNYFERVLTVSWPWVNRIYLCYLLFISSRHSTLLGRKQLIRSGLKYRCSQKLGNLFVKYLWWMIYIF